MERCGRAHCFSRAVAVPGKIPSQGREARRARLAREARSSPPGRARRSHLAHAGRRVFRKSRSLNADALYLAYSSRMYMQFECRRVTTERGAVREEKWKQGAGSNTGAVVVQSNVRESCVCTDARKRRRRTSVTRASISLSSLSSRQRAGPFSPRQEIRLRPLGSCCSS